MMRYAAVVMGASFGGIKTLQEIFAELTYPLPWPVMIVQHIAADTTAKFSEVFDLSSGLKVVEAMDKLRPEPGVVYFAPPGYHLLIERDGCLSLSVEDPVHWSRPSIDVLFETAAEAHGPSLMGIILTGASADGARGLKSIKSIGGLTIAQDPETAEARIMPEAAIGLASADYILAPKDIGQLLVRLAQNDKVAPTTVGSTDV